MQEYVEYDGLLFDEYEWAVAISKSDKSLLKAQKSRRREVTKGFAKIKEGK